MAIALDVWAFDVGLAAPTPMALAEEFIGQTESCWDAGADLVLFPEYAWMGLERFHPGDGLAGVAELFWTELWPNLQTRLRRPGKAVVLGTVPWEESPGHWRNRAPIVLADAAFGQDKLFLTPWETELAGGQELILWELGDLRVAVVICLDIEVPELAAKLRGQQVDLLLVPSATETALGMERVTRCACARAVELGCYVAVSPLVGRTESALVDENVGRIAFFAPAQAAFQSVAREHWGPPRDAGCHCQRFEIDLAALACARRMKQETNPARVELRPILLVQR